MPVRKRRASPVARVAFAERVGGERFIPSTSADPTHPHHSVADNNSQIKTIGFQGTRMSIAKLQAVPESSPTGAKSAEGIE